jgi:hypothetical protein
MKWAMFASRRSGATSKFFIERKMCVRRLQLPEAGHAEILHRTGAANGAVGEHFLQAHI